MTSETLAASGLLVALTMVVIFVLVRRLQASEQRFRLLAEHTEDLVCFQDVGGKYVYVSPSVERLLGWTPKEFMRGGPTIFPDDKNTLRAFQERVQGGETERVLYRIQRKNGTVIWFETWSYPLPNGGVASSSRDVTARKVAEDMYRYLAANLPKMSVVLYDRDLRIIVAEGELIGRHGHTQEKMEGGTFRQVYWRDYDAEEIGQIQDHWVRAIQGQKSESESSLAGSMYRSYHLPMIMGGRIVGGMVVTIDITEQRNREIELQERTDDLERSNRELEQFADVASHELKTPLRHIAGFAELLADEHEGLLGKDADDYIHNILGGVGEMRGVIEALLRYSRAKTEENRMERVSLSHLVAQVVSGLRDRTKEMGAKVEVDLKSLPVVKGDPVLLRQLMENLIWNGVKFASPGAVVRVHAARRLMDWEITVEDNGPGVDKEHQESIFLMFKRSRPDVEGSGVGLALCRKIVGIHRGRIWVEEAGGPKKRPGATFRFTLPARNWDEVTQH